MTRLEQIKQALKCCSLRAYSQCLHCPYFCDDLDKCFPKLVKDTLDKLTELERDRNNVDTNNQKGDWINSDYITCIHPSRACDTLSIPVIAYIHGRTFTETITYCDSWQEAETCIDELVHSMTIGVKIKSYYKHKGDTT